MQVIQTLAILFSVCDYITKFGSVLNFVKFNKPRHTADFQGGNVSAIPDPRELEAKYTPPPAPDQRVKSDLRWHHPKPHKKVEEKNTTFVLAPEAVRLVIVVSVAIVILGAIIGIVIAYGHF